MPLIITRTSSRIVAASASLIVLASGCASSPEVIEPPRVAGQTVPGKAISIDFNKRFDIHTRLGNQPTDFFDCKFVGFAESEGAGGDWKWISSSSADSFPRGWLVIENSSGRRMYIPAGSVIYFEDAAQ